MQRVFGVGQAKTGVNTASDLDYLITLDHSKCGPSVAAEACDLHAAPIYLVALKDRESIADSTGYERSRQGLIRVARKLLTE